MRKLLVSLTAAMVLGGCTSDWDPDRKVSTASQATPAARNDAAAQAVGPVAAARRVGFASLPDRGALLSIDRSREPVRHAAFTQYPVQLSEAHALNAAVPGGRIEIPTPSGKTVEVSYVRHEESLDGNWTWIGKTIDGLETVITFGPDAVFGRIAQSGTEPLRLTMSSGRSWLVETDPTKVLDGNLRRDADEPDMLVPPQLAANIAETKRRIAASDVQTAANGSNTIDVVLGYTNGLVTKYGGVSQANTRLVNLMALTNQAYVNSRIDPRVRLVRTVQISYTDTNSNEIALEALTGVNCTTTGCTSQPVPTELVPLRTARDDYGGDLVSLVRPFRTPEQDGCGIAWLLGGGGFAIDNTDAPFGYSIVSDGTDVDEGDGRTYFCREETLAHELGHNMGQAHNVEDSSSQGTHSYSYGYREATTTGFYTVMAYRLGSSSQFPINFFANPSVNYLDTARPTGTATADNARSMNQSMLLVAPFRATVVPFLGRIRNDLNGDGRSDLIWYNNTSFTMAYWWMNNTTVTSTGQFVVGSAYRIATTGDLDGDGRTDILWVNSSTNQVYLWRSRGDGQFDTPFVANYAAGWNLIRTADINGDTRDDLIWENTTTGQMAYWLMSGATVQNTGLFTVGTAYRVVGTGDFDGDGRGDILWANPSLGYLYLWRSRGDGTFDTPFVAGYANTWGIAGITDINGDGTSDIVWEETTQGLMAYWFMNGATIQGSGVKSVGTAYRIATTGDLDGDGRGDLVWANSSTGLLFLWRSLGNGNFDTPFLAGYSPAWSLLR